MNPIIITIIIATATFVLSIFGALQFYSQRMEKYIDAKVEGLRAELKAEIRAEIGPLRSDVEHLKQTTEKIERQLETIFGKLVWPKSGD